MLGLLLGGPLRSLVGGPLAIIAGIAAIAALCGCMSCMKSCRLRQCVVMKRLLRLIGHDAFDDFELMILVHEALFERKNNRDKINTAVRITAGAHTVQTDWNSNGVFQQPLHIEVEQGTEQLVVDLLNADRTVMATLPLDIAFDILKEENLQPEMIYTMKQKGKGISNPQMKLTLVVSSADGDAEMGLVAFHSAGGDAGMDMLVNQQMRKAHLEAKNFCEGHEGQSVSEMLVLKKACVGPLEIFEGLGKTRSVYASVIGPPESKHWIFGFWKEQKDCEDGLPAAEQIDLLKVQSVQADPSRHHVFLIHYFDAYRTKQCLTFRRVDRARDVWVEILLLLVTKAREQNKGKKKTVGKSTSSSSSFRARPSHSDAGSESGSSFRP